jgi:protocatechuate 3,4-dioxygenase beta subunit
MRRLASGIALLSAFALIGYAQAPLREQPLGTSATGTIRGWILASGTHDPLRNARVQVTSDVGGAMPPAFSDSEGRFVLPSLATGSYRLSAAKPGYVTTNFGAPRFHDAGTPIVVANGAIVEGIEVQLPQSAAISGRIVDGLGDAVVSAPVAAEIRSTPDAKTATFVAATTQTDDLGDYRLGGLPAGDVLVVATVGPAILGPDGNELPPGVTLTIPITPQGSVNQRATVRVNTESAMTRTYYPGVTDLAQAQAMTLAPGDEHTSIDFVVPSGPPRMLNDLIRSLGYTLALPPPPPNPPAPPLANGSPVAETGAIRGRVTRADGRALPNAVVRLPSAFPSRTTVTDEEGRYEFLKLPAGSYAVRASRSGLSTVEYGQRHAFDPGEPVELGPGDACNGVDIVLPTPAVVAGRLVDDDGDAVEGADVRVLQMRYQGGRRRLAAVPGVVPRRTDDLGRYRIYGLPPGEYIVRALVGQVVVGESIFDRPGYAPTYFPGTWKVDEARLVHVDLAQEISGVDLSLVRVPTARVSGRAFDAEGNPGQEGLGLFSSRRSGSVAGTPVGARIGRDGTFEFPNLPPGEYVVQAWQSHKNGWTEGEFASQFVLVNGSDIPGLAIHRSIGSTIRGRITLEGSSPLKPTEIDLSPIPVDADLSPPVDPANAKIKDDWTFEVDGISGPRRVTLMRAPAGWTLKRVLINGIDVADTSIPLGRTDQSIEGMEVVLTDRGGEVSGRLTDSRGRLLTDYTVVVFATDREHWFLESRFLKQARPGRDGVFAVRGLPDGDYFVAAVDQLHVDEWPDPDFLDSLISSATRVTLAEGQKVSVTPRLLAR